LTFVNDSFRLLNSMPLLIALSVYPIQEICETLAKRKGREVYSRQRVALLIKTYLPTALKIDNQYYLTDKEIEWLASKIGEKRG